MKLSNRILFMILIVGSIVVLPNILFSQIRTYHFEQVYRKSRKEISLFLFILTGASIVKQCKTPRLKTTVLSIS